MNWNGGYYLHANRKLIYKPHGLEQRDIDDSDFVVKYWNNADIGKTPRDFVLFLKDAFVLGANKDEILRLATHNKLDKYVIDWDSQVFGENK